MTIQLTKNTYVAGVLSAAGSQHTLDAQTESYLVHIGAATWVETAYTQGRFEDAKIEYDIDGVAVGIVGRANEVVGPVWATDDSGNVTGLASPSGGGGVSLQIPPCVPPGLPWLSDTLHGIDLYAKGFIKTPTLFFDPQATDSLGRGTLANPYTTQAQLEAAIKGNMAGHVLGLKRGSKLVVTGGALSLNVYGSASSPFYIVPYGDAEALPIISGEYDISELLTQAAGSSIVWKYAQGANSLDIWQDDIRLKRLHPTNGTRNNNTGTTVTNEATAVTALTAKGAGWMVLVGTDMYVRPYGESISGSTFLTTGTGATPNSNALAISISDVAATGNIIVAGVDARYARNSVISIGAATRVNITSCGTLQVVGCRARYAGVDNSASLGRDGILVYGPTGAVRAEDIYVAGNYIEDALNNAVEIAGIDGGIIENNIGYNCGGNTIAELWSSCSNVDVRYNYGDYSNNSQRAYITESSLSGSGIWLANNVDSTGAFAAANDATNAENANNSAYCNIISRPYSRGIRLDGGTGHKIYHNTVYIKDDDTVGAASSGAADGWRTFGDASAGFADISNNLFYWAASTRPVKYPSMVRMGTLGASASIPTGNNNIYFHNFGLSNGNFYYNGAGESSFTTYKTALAGYGLDQASLCVDQQTGGTVSLAELAFNEITKTPGAGSVALAAGLTTLQPTIGNRYQDGAPYVAASCTVGALLGG